MTAPIVQTAARPRLVRSTAVRRFFKQPLAVASLAFLMLVIAAAVLAPVISPYPFDYQNLGQAFQAPNGQQHLLGTDDLGRDVVSRLLFGAQTSLSAAFQATALAVVLGIPLGMVAGFAGKWVDAILSRLADAFMTFPALLLAIVIVGIMGPGLSNAMIAIGVVYAPRLFRVGRAAVISVASETYIKAARTIGQTPLRILMRNVLPNALSPILVQISLTMGTSILMEASLSFLGLGVQSPETSWGSILGRGVPYITMQPFVVISSGLIISLVVLAFNLLGDGVRDSIGRERRS